jgi:uncharacterized repeat protein (TIGR03803 family)
MPNKKALASMIAVLTVICGFLTATHAFAASKVKVLYSFKDNGTDGRAPIASLIFDAAGNLYGTTGAGGATNKGTVFELKHGAWAETVLHSFTGEPDGWGPSAGLIFDAAGNLYGTTAAGGANNMGTVFELTPVVGGTWTETVLYNFCPDRQCADGDSPRAGLIFDGAGNMYGTTFGGGAYNGGTIFQLVPGVNGTWTEVVLYSFDRIIGDGIDPSAGVIFDSSGNLYGTTSLYGHKPCCDAGTAFELTPGVGGWTETLLYSFRLDDYNSGDEPYAGLIFDASGNLYGTTSMGGAYRKPCGGAGCGTVFQLTPRVGGGWKQTELHSFGKDKDGEAPQACVVRDSAGNLYGTTLDGGAYGYGTVFRLVPGTNGKWTEKVLHSFAKGMGGASPYAGLIFDADGNLYGTTSQGGANNSGTVFEITP